MIDGGSMASMTGGDSMVATIGGSTPWSMVVADRETFITSMLGTTTSMTYGVWIGGFVLEVQIIRNEQPPWNSNLCFLSLLHLSNSIIIQLLSLKFCFWVLGKWRWSIERNNNLFLLFKLIPKNLSHYYITQLSGSTTSLWISMEEVVEWNLLEKMLL